MDAPNLEVPTFQYNADELSTKLVRLSKENNVYKLGEL